MQPIKTIGIIGLGVIGASLGLAVRNNAPQTKVLGRDIQASIVSEAIELGAIDGGLTDDQFNDCEIVVIATPLRTIPEIIQDIKDKLCPGTLVSDVGSVKGWVMRVFADNLPKNIRFIGGHPMAGSEKSGLKGADKFLLQNAAYIITPLPDTQAADLDKITWLVQAAGSRLVVMKPEEHDELVAKVSHIPHIMAGAIINNLTGQEDYLALAGGGLRDTTRIAASSPELWEDILTLNSQAIVKETRQMIAQLIHWQEALSVQDRPEINRCLALASGLRKKIPNLRPGLQDSIDVVAIIPDQPGIIGDLGVLLGKHAINIQDIKLLGIRDEDEGSITFTVKREDAQKACSLIKEQGYSSWLR